MGAGVVPWLLVHGGSAITWYQCTDVLLWHDADVPWYCFTEPLYWITVVLLYCYCCTVL